MIRSKGLSNSTKCICTTYIHIWTPKAKVLSQNFNLLFGEKKYIVINGSSVNSHIQEFIRFIFLNSLIAASVV